MVVGLKLKGIISPPSPVTKNFVLSVFQAFVSADAGEKNARPVLSGRVF